MVKCQKSSLATYASVEIWLFCDIRPNWLTVLSLVFVRSNKVAIFVCCYSVFPCSLLLFVVWLHIFVTIFRFQFAVEISGLNKIGFEIVSSALTFTISCQFWFLWHSKSCFSHKSFLNAVIRKIFLLEPSSSKVKSQKRCDSPTA